MIAGEDIENAERALVASRSIAGGIAESVLYDRARVLPESCDAYMAKLREDVRKRVPNLDPRIEPTMMTMFRHAFLVGVIAGREDSRREQ